MIINFNKFVNIGQGSFSPTTPLTILIGNNGVGKTLLLETYTKINDYLLREIVRNDFFESILEKADFEIELLKTDENIVESDGKFNYKYRSVSDFVIRVKNSSLILDNYDRNIKEILEKVEDIIKTEVLFTDPNDNVDIIRDFGINLEMDWCEIFESLVFTIYQDSVVEGMTVSDVEEDEEDDFSFPFLTINIEEKNSRNSQGFLVTEEESEANRKQLLSGNFEYLIPRIIRAYSSKLESKFLELNSISDITYIPSERIVSMSKFLEKQFSSNNYDGLRYSEEKFAKSYTEFKEYFSLSSMRLKRKKMMLNESYNKLLGGEPIFNTNGEITAIKTESGEVISRSLFSTKQNKIYPFFLLHSMTSNIFSRRFDSERTIIIEEPEANLSTKSILEMATYISQLTDEYKVILSTHSDIFLTQLNNEFINKKKLSYMSGYEILEGNELHELRKLSVNPELGVSSNFISSQLDILYQITTDAQNFASSNDEIEGY